MASLRQRLLDIENDLFEFVSGDSLHIDSTFKRKWAQLLADTESATQAGILDEDTKSLAHTVASKIEITANLVNKLDSAFDSLDLDALAVPDDFHASSESETDPTPIPQPPSIRSDPSLPPYIEPAYKWLLKHLHNPYPKKSIKEKIADETGSTIERISDWFVDVRRRMGWTTLLREEFGRKRTDLIDAATRHFIGTADKSPLPVDIHGKFVQMEVYAQDMYAAKFMPSALSNKMTAAVKDLTPELQEKARLERLQKLKAQREAAKYPSPAPSGSSSPTSDASRKRAYSEVSDEDGASSSKRLRTDDGAFALPSPPYSSHSSPTSRKRRLSDTGAPASKRPRTNARVVSDPIVVTLSGTPDILADWFSSDSPGNTNIFEPGQLLDIQFFDPEQFAFTAEEEPEPPAPLAPVIVQTIAPPMPENLTFDMSSGFDISGDLQSFDTDDFFKEFLQEPPLVIQPTSFAPDMFINPSVSVVNPGVWQADSQPFLNPMAGTYDTGFVPFAEPYGLESFEQVYSAPGQFPDGKASGNFINGLLAQQDTQQYHNQNDFALYQPSFTNSY
ncbi:hypothetical protein C8R45DRAFT_953547 [Mycena sanguinolenta]|nr:hypothetical protein C8R45DRAFT_953547 [Mycena sanguinolenta]